MLAIFGETIDLKGAEEVFFALIVVIFYSSPLWIPCAGLMWAIKKEQFSLKFLFAVTTAEAVSLGAVFWFGERIATLWPWAPL